MSATTSAPNDETIDRTVVQTLIIGGLDRCEHPRRAFEQVGPRAVDAFELGARHRVAAHVTRVAHQLEHRRLHAAHIGDQPTGVAQRSANLVGHGADGSGDEGDVGVGVVADRIERAELERPFGRASVGVAAGDVPALLPQA